MNSQAIDPNVKYVRANDVVSTNMNGEVVMMCIKKGAYFSLTGTGGPIWDRLEKPMTFDELSQSLGEEFDLNEGEETKGLVSGFLTKLVTEGLVVPAD